MANNYFGFTPTGTQYAPGYNPAQPAAAAYTGQAAYAPAQSVVPVAATQYGAAQVQQATPQAQQRSYQAAYDSHAAVAVATAPGAAYAYTAARPAAAVVTIAVTPHYQAGSYQVAASRASSQSVVASRGTDYSGYSGARGAGGQGTYTVGSGGAQRDMGGGTTTTYSASSGHDGGASASSSYSGYDAALYSAASNYYQQQRKGPGGGGGGGGGWQHKKEGGGGGGGGFMGGPGGGGSGGGGSGPGGMRKNFYTKFKAAPKVEQLHYCEICKISCAGPETYRQHLKGSKHKKREEALKDKPAGTSTAPLAGKGQCSLRCELCDISCTGTDAYTAHIRGAKHQKTVQLHQRMGKPIPSSDPTIVDPNGVARPSGTKLADLAKPSPKKVVAPPRVKFVGSTPLKMTTGDGENKDGAGATPVESGADSAKPTYTEGLLPGEKQPVPVGTEYVEEIKNAAGKITSFKCKLCDCQFNDVNAKEMHMKGRRHRLAYKKKVDPQLKVEVKSSNQRNKRLLEERYRRESLNNMIKKRNAFHSELRVLEEGRFQTNVPRPPVMGGPRGPQAGPGRWETWDDRHVRVKHAEVYPTEAELAEIQDMISACEKSLKTVSDDMMKLSAKEAGKEATVSDENEQYRLLRGVHRVGALSKGLLLSGDLRLDLVVTCRDKPTKGIVTNVGALLSKQFKDVCDGQFQAKACLEQGHIVVRPTKGENKGTMCTITFTSQLMRKQEEGDETMDTKDDEGAKEGENGKASEDGKAKEAESTAASASPPAVVPDPPNMLDLAQCLKALAWLRRAKFFQARVTDFPTSMIVIRLLHKLKKSEPALSPLPDWAIELLVERCCITAPAPQGPGDSLRRVFECLASGLLLPGGPGMVDPCERVPTDAAGNLTLQQRDTLTLYAQTAVRQIAFKKIHMVLGMDLQPTPAAGGPGVKRPHPEGEGVDGQGAPEGVETKKAATE